MSPASAEGMWLFRGMLLLFTAHVSCQGLLGLLLRRFLMLAMPSVVRTLPAAVDLFSGLLLFA